MQPWGLILWVRGLVSYKLMGDHGTKNLLLHCKCDLEYSPSK